MTDGQQTASTVRRELYDYISEAFLYMHPNVELGEDDKFLELGLIDSLGFVELVEEVQSRFGVAVEDIEITEENFGSIAALADFIERKRAA
jgi:acyl carrier protein